MADVRESSEADQAPGPAEAAPARRRRGWPRLPRTGRGRLGLTALVVLCLLLAGGGWVAVRGAQARDHLGQAAVLVGQLQQQVRTGDTAALRSTLAALQRQTRAARVATRDPLWRIGARAPRRGADLAAVSTIAAVLDDLARHGFPGLVTLADGFDATVLKPRNGSVDMTVLDRVGPAVAAAEAAIRRARDRLTLIDVAGLLPQIRSAVTELRAGLDRAAALIGSVTRATALLPTMLGAGRPRTCLVMFQNLAEVRATGGMLGAYVVIRTDRGAIRIIDQGTAASDLLPFERPVRPVDPAMTALYTDRLATYPADVNLTPHFPTAATLAREMYRRRSGRTVDAVLATDPVAMSYLLRASGPVPIPPHPPLTADNAVRTLLSDVYAHLDPAQQDAYFARAARAVFEVLTRAQGDPRTVVASLAQAVGERRILLWSADPAEQALIAGTSLEGALPEHDGDRPTVGVFLNDGSGAKLGYYLTRSVKVEPGGCRRDGRRELVVQVGLHSTAPRSGLSASVLGLGLSGNPYTVRTNVLVFSPAGGSLVDAQLDGVATGVGTGAERGRTVGVLTVDVRPGQRRLAQFRLLTDVLPGQPQATVRPRLWTTPGVTPWLSNVVPSAACR